MVLGGGVAEARRVVQQNNWELTAPSLWSVDSSALSRCFGLSLCDSVSRLIDWSHARNQYARRQRCGLHVVSSRHHPAVSQQQVSRV